MQKLSRLIILVILLSPEIVLADFNRLIKDVFPSGTMSNVTNSAIVQEQSAGHLIGGSIVIKSPAEPPLQLVAAQAPSCKMGGLPCGAQFELLGGSLSVVNGAKLMEHLKALPQSAATYAAMMAIKSFCPQCQDLLEWLDAKADWLNKLSFDKCEAVQGLVDPVLAKVEAESQVLRQSASVLEGTKKDMAQIQQESKKARGDPSKESAELKDQLSQDYNLVWKALGNSADANELKELLMSVSGSVIAIRSNDEHRRAKVSYWPSLVNKELIKQFIGIEKDQGKIQLYKCDEHTECLKPKEVDVSIGNKDNLLFSRIEKMLGSIISKIYKNDKPFSLEEEMLIALSSVQLIPKIEMDLAKYRNIQNVINNQSFFVEALCYDVITHHLQSMLTTVQKAINQLKGVQLVNADKFEKFEENIRATMRDLSAARVEAYGRYDAIAASKNRLKMELEQFDQEFAGYLNKLE